MRTLYTPSVIDEATEADLWRNAIIVFDTCALLDFYYMTVEYQRIMAEILTYLSDRIWLPAQVMAEYEKNHDSAMLKPKEEKYRAKDIQNNRLVDDLKKYIELWEKQYYHPYLGDDKLNKVKAALNIIEPKIAEVKTIVAMEYQERRREIDAIGQNDVLNNVVHTLHYGVPFTFAEIKQIVEEGAFRYANLIPPGYKDSETKEGIHQYGDLIIWKEILRYAKNENRDIIWISNDTKSDWVIADETNTNPKAEKPANDEIGKPRRELLVEFYEETGHTIWFYQTADFIKRLEELYKPTQTELKFYGQLGVVRDVLMQAEKERRLKRSHIGDAILIRCDECRELFALDAGELNFEWEGGIVDDRGMGYESEYESEESCECPNCMNQIDLTLQVWEYPMGAFNNQNLEIDGGEIEKPINLANYISFEDYESCIICGERTVLDENDLCEHCAAELQRKMDADD